MASTTLLCIVWPLTLGLSYMAGSMIISNKSTTENSKDGNQSPKVSRKNSLSNGSTNETTAATNRRSSSSTSHVGKDAYTGSNDIKEITNINDPKKRFTMLLRMIDQLDPRDFKQVVADFRGLGMISKRTVEYRILLNAWAKVNPQGALTYTQENTKSSFASTTILSAWARYAPDAAIQWVKLNHEGNKASPYLVGIIKGITSTNPERATNMLRDVLDRDRDEAVRAILPHVSKLSTEKTIAWLATIKDKNILSVATGEIASSIATKNPQGAIDLLQALPEDTQKNEHGVTIARAWAKLDIDKAVEWTDSLIGKNRHNAAMQIMHQFASSDPNKAATWMKTMSGDPSYSYLAQEFISLIHSEHPEIAIANLDQLPLVTGRRKMHEYYTLRSWATKNKAAATQWMQSNNIDAALQERILFEAAQKP